MLTINLYDTNFENSMRVYGYYTSTDNVRPSVLKWVKGEDRDMVSVFTDRMLWHVMNSEAAMKVAWIIEPREVFGSQPHRDVVKLEHQFDLIFTHDKRLLKRGDKYKLAPWGGCWIPEEDWAIYPKKIVKPSLIASNKTMTQGHNLRHVIAREFGDRVDMVGHHPYRPIKNKLEVLCDRAFAVVVMNAREENWFSELLIDTLVTGTVPIFWGCPNIADYFDVRGFLSFSNLDQLDDILDNLSMELYDSMKTAIINNFEEAKRYKSTDDLFGIAFKKEVGNG